MHYRILPVTMLLLLFSGCGIIPPLSLNQTNGCHQDIPVGSDEYYRCAILEKERELAQLTLPSPRHQSSRNNTTKQQLEQDIAQLRAERANQQTLISTQQRNAQEQWEASEAAKAKQFEKQDHEFCTQKGFTPGKLMDPNTEKYYDCRSFRLEKRISPPPENSGYSKDRFPNVVLAFQRKAHEARETFDAQNQSDHEYCLAKGFIPGHKRDPRTYRYYDCRANLAKNGLGPVVAKLFTEDAAAAKKEASDHSVCKELGYQTDSTLYVQCRRSHVSKEQCLSKISSRLQARTKRDRDDCRDKAEIELPEHLARELVKKSTSVDEYGDVVTSTIQNRPDYTQSELQTARSKLATLCLSEKDRDRIDFKKRLINDCMEIMNILPKPMITTSQAPIPIKK